MVPPVAMAGMAEGAEQTALLVAWGSLLLVGVLVWAGASTRSAATLKVALALLATFTLLFMPFRAFAPGSAEAAADPDVMHWADAWRRLAFGWAVACVAAVGAVPAVWSRRRRRAIRVDSARPPVAR